MKIIKNDRNQTFQQQQKIKIFNKKISKIFKKNKNLIFSQNFHTQKFIFSSFFLSQKISKKYQTFSHQKKKSKIKISFKMFQTKSRKFKKINIFTQKSQKCPTKKSRFFQKKTQK